MTTHRAQDEKDPPKKKRRFLEKMEEGDWAESMKEAELIEADRIATIKKQLGKREP